MKLILLHDNQVWCCPGAPHPECFFELAPSLFTFSEAVTAAPYPLASLPLLPDLTLTACTAQPPHPAARLFTLRELYLCLPAETFALIGLAQQLGHWRRVHRFCGACGHPLTRHPVERAMVCESCGHQAYPRLNPVVITLIHKGDQILLVKKKDIVLPFWSLVAGFVETHETLEQAVEREALEEVGIQVCDIQYVKSQPWPFPNNIMLGFTAAWAGGTLCPDGVEISQADWFDRHHLPALPTRMSIARDLIDRFFAPA